MWHHHVRRAGRHAWRLLLALLVLVLLLAGALLALLGSETGSRWLLEQGLGMQKVLEARYQRGTFLGGLELADVRVTTTGTELQVRQLLARWSVWSLLRAEFTVDRLELHSVDLRRRVPASPDPVQLPTLILPLRLHVTAAEATGVRYWSHGADHPQELDRLVLAEAAWSRTRVRFGRLALEHARLGRLELGGTIRLRGSYPLQARGTLDYPALRGPGWGLVAVSLGGSVEDLDIGLTMAGKVAASARGRIQPLDRQLPYVARLQWGTLAWPWWSDHALRSGGGTLAVTGDRAGLRGSLDAQLEARHLPAGRYALTGRTDWHSAKVGSLVFTGLGGKLEASGDVGWQEGLRWTLAARMAGIDLARKWPIPRLAVPVLTGQLESSGRTSSGGGALEARLQLAGGERWDVRQTASSWAWRLEDAQQLVAQWSGVTRTLDNGQTIVADAGQLRAEGRRGAYTAVLETGLAGSRLPAGRWRTTLQGSERRVRLERVDYEGEAGRLGFQGELALERPLRWSGQLDLNDFATGWALPAWPGRFSGSLAGGGSWGERRRDFQLSAAHLEGELLDQPFALDGPLEILLQPGAWPELRSEGLGLRWGRNQALLTGGLRNDQWDLAAELDLADISLLVPGVEGRLLGEVGLQGPRQRPDASVRLAGEHLSRGGLGIPSATLDATLPALGEQPGQVRLVLEGLTTASDRDWGRIVLQAQGLRRDHALDWEWTGDDVQAGGLLAGALGDDGWSGRFLSGKVAAAGLEWGLEQPYAIAWQRAARRLWLAPHCWRSAGAELCNLDEMRLGASGHVRFALRGLALERVQGVWPEGMSLAGRVEGSVLGDWAPGEAPRLEAELEARDGEVMLTREDGQPALVRQYDRIVVQATAGLRQVDLSLDLASADMGQGEARLRIDPYAEGKPVSGRVALEGLRLGIFQPFFPGISTLAGQLSAQGQLGGRLARPVFTGRLRLAGGEVAFQRLPLHVTDLETTVDVHGTEASIAGTMRSGEGGATLAGSADWSGEPRLDLTLKGSRFQLSQPPELVAEVEPDLALTLVSRRASLTGSLVVPAGRLNFKRLTEQAVPLSPDIRVVHARDRDAVQVTGEVNDWDINADIRLRLGDDVYFQGYGVTGRLKGGMRLRQEGRRGLEASGEVELDKEARYDAYGQRLQIRRGRLIFAGNLSQPGLDVEAIRTIDDKVVGVRVEGRANAPEATLFADTPMSQEEIVSYLVLGRPLDTQGRPDGSAGNLTAAAAAIKLGATGVGEVGLTDRVGETLGISDLSLDAEGSGDDTLFTVSGYLSPKLYLRYGVGIFTPVNTATLRYKINARLYLEAVSSLESAIDLFYNMRF